MAQFNLGVVYGTGQGVSQDLAEAMRWTRLAADQGHAKAQHVLASAYATGEGAPKDLTDSPRRKTR